MTSTYTANVSPFPANGQITDTFLTSLVDNDDFQRNPPEASYSPSTGAATITTTSTTMVALTSFTVTFTTQGRQILVMFNGRGNGTTVRFDITLDSVSITGDSDGVGAIGATGEFSILRLVAASAGPHTIAITWRVTSGTGSVYPPGLCQLYCREW